MHPESEQNPGADPEIPRPLIDVWLRFHEKELCQDLDTVFVFRPKGMEVWCLVEDERSYQRFSEMLEPLRSSFEIDVYATRLTPEKKTKDDDEPPPSLWNNDALQAYLSDTARGFPDPGQQDNSPYRISRRSVLKQRLMLWSGQILSWNKKVRRYAWDLPDLASAGFGAGADTEVRRRSAAVCLAHAQNLDKNLARLSDNIAEALPSPDKKALSQSKQAKSNLPSSPAELVTMASSRAREVAERIYRFIYPQDYTVGLNDLKQSSLMEALRDVRNILSELQKSAGSLR